MVNPNLFRPPDINILARDVNPGHKEELMTSFLLRGTEDARVDGLIWEFNGYTCDDVVNDTDFPLDIQAIVGLHSSTAIKEGLEFYPDNEDFLQTPAMLFMCPRTPQNIAIAHAWGNMQNKIASTVLPMTAFDYMKQCRASFDELQVRFPDSSKISQSAKRKETAVKIKELSVAWGVPGPSVQQYWGVCNRTQEIWENILKIFRGEVQHSNISRFIKPNSTTHFVHMAKVPDDKLLSWLRCIVRQGPQCSSTKVFMAKCVWYKKSIVIQAAVLSYLSSTHGTDYVDWDEFAAKQDWVSPEWFSDHASTNLP
jgi:hypothetical protein